MRASTALITDTHEHAVLLTIDATASEAPDNTEACWQSRSA